MVVGDMIFQAKIVKQLIRYRLRAHHRAILLNKTVKKMESHLTDLGQILFQQNLPEAAIRHL
jgi:hypothetical protein